MSDLLLDNHIAASRALGFWDEMYISTLKLSIENRYNTEIIRNWLVSDVTINGDKVLFKWSKRIIPLTDEQIKDNYGREV